MSLIYFMNNLILFIPVSAERRNHTTAGNYWQEFNLEENSD